MEIAPQHALRTLRYIDIVNSYGGKLTTSDIDAYAKAHPPKDLIYGTALDQTMTYFNSHKLSSPQAVSGFLKSIGWITTSSDNITLTSVGEAVLRAELADEERSEAPGPGQVQDVVLSPDNPMAIVHLIRRLAEAGEGMVVDPYFQADMLTAVCESTTINRILIANKREKDAIGYALYELGKTLDRVPEVRNSKQRKMHDRCIITATGQVSLVGGSMNGIGTHLTSIIHPDAPVQEFYREQYEKIWDEANPIEPKPFQESVTPKTQE